MITASTADSRCGRSATRAEKEKHHCTHAQNSITHETDDSTHSPTTVFKDSEMLEGRSHYWKHSPCPNGAPVANKGTWESEGKYGCEKRTTWTLSSASYLLGQLGQFSNEMLFRMEKALCTYVFPPVRKDDKCFLRAWSLMCLNSFWAPFSPVPIAGSFSAHTE